MVWLLLDLALVATIFLARPLVLGKEPVTLPLVTMEDRSLRQRLVDVARSPSQNVVLVLNGVEANSRPEASWEVHVEPVGVTPDARDSFLVGVVSLFDRGIRSAAGQERDPAQFLFALDTAIATAGERALQVRFVPISGVVDRGGPQAANVRANVTIREVNLAVETVSRP